MSGDPATRAAAHVWWMEDALAREPAEAPPTVVLEEAATADVCIVGGGYTGLWTAIHLKRAEPSLDVVLIERDICGSGASGRNSGFAMSWWSKYASFAKLVGPEDALALCRACADAVAEIGRFCAEHGIAADYAHDGWVWTATSAAQLDAWDAAVAPLEARGIPAFERLTREQAIARSHSPIALGGVLEPTVATLQPAALARGMRRVAIAAGVRVFERTPMTRLGEGTPPLVETPKGRVCAERVVLALNAWAARFSSLRRQLVVISTDVLATAPMRERLEEIGWSDGVGVTDSRRLVNAWRPTHDGRLTLAKGGGTLRFGGRLGDAYDRPSPRRAEVLAHFHRAYPQLGNVGATHGWRGPIDYSVSGLPYFGPLGGRPDVLVGVGFSGNGVAPTYLGAQMLAGEVLSRDLGFTHPLLARPPHGSLPPEPFRYVGGLLVRRAIGAKEAREDAGRRVPAATRAVAKLDPTSFIDTG